MLPYRFALSSPFSVYGSRFTENPKRKEVKSGKGFHAKGIRRAGVSRAGGSGFWGQHFSLPPYAAHILDGPEPCQTRCQLDPYPLDAGGCLGCSAVAAVTTRNEIVIEVVSGHIVCRRDGNREGDRIEIGGA